MSSAAGLGGAARGRGPWRDGRLPGSELPAAREYDVLVAISRSGTTTEVVHALQRGLAPRTVALTALTDSPVSDAAGDVIDLSFADERSVVQTRFATTALSLLRALVDPESIEPAVADAQRALSEPLPASPSEIEEWTFLGRGWAAGLAFEAALKLRETAPAWTEAYPAFEYRHGPIAIAAPWRVVWSLGPMHPDIAENIRRTGASVVAPDEPRNLTRSIVLSDGEADLLSSRGA